MTGQRSLFVDQVDPELLELLAEVRPDIAASHACAVERADLHPLNGEHAARRDELGACLAEIDELLENGVAA